MGAFAYVPAGISSFIVLEKERDVKHQLIISGCGIPAYWISNFLFDIAAGLIPVAGALIVLKIYNVSALVTEPGTSGSVTLLFLFLPASAGSSYLLSFLFRKAGTALMVAWLANLCTGFLSLIVISLVLNLDETTGMTLRWLLRLVPMYCLGNGFAKLAQSSPAARAAGVNAFAGTLVGGMSCYPPPPGKKQYADRDCDYLVGDEVFFLVLDSVLYWGLAIGLDLVSTLPFFKQLFASKVALPATHQSNEDPMVLEEKKHVSTLDPNTQLIWVHNVRKVYGGVMHAVRGISFACEQGQVFGLLGVNGAGKTTTFKMLCGQVEPTEGEVRVKGMNVATEVHRVRKLIGYCPQFDALLDNLTTEEHLYLFGRLKGLSGPQLKSAVEVQLQELDLLGFRSSRANQLSGGNKRKLSVGMATIAEPAMVFLDEPSAGMDPVARRFMWKVVQNIAEKRKKSVVILTTHSMEEAEALCSRIAIQVDGLFRCLGTAQQIKSRYGEGLELNVRVSPTTQEEMDMWCKAAEAPATEIVTPQVGMQKMVQSMGEDAARQLVQRPGCVLSSGLQDFQLGQLAEWCLLESRIQKLESFLHRELSAEINGATSLMAVELSGTSLRYRILPQALQGRFKSLGTFFQLLQQNQKEYQIEDFQVSQASLEQIFNRFAAGQMGQQANVLAREGLQQQVTIGMPPSVVSTHVPAKSKKLEDDVCELPGLESPPMQPHISIVGKKLMERE